MYGRVCCRNNVSVCVFRIHSCCICHCLFLICLQKNLYLYLICYEKEARVSRPSDENVLKTEWMLRKDKIEIALSSGNFGERDYAVFCADTEKQVGARTEKGMTYFGGDKAILNDYRKK